MKRRLIALVLATSTIVGALASTTTTAKAQSFNEVYQATYNTVIHLQELGNKYHITPRHSNDGTKMEDNKLSDVAASVEEMQQTINTLRDYQYQFPDAFWKARNTFSAIGDGYQQPIYEWIVDVAIRLQKQVKETNGMSKETLAKFIADAEIELQSANKLNKGVDPAYRGAYQVALDNVATALNTLKENLKDTKKEEVKPEAKKEEAKPEAKKEEVKPSKQYLSDGRLTQLLYDKYGKGEWNNEEELAQFRNIFNALINGQVDNERIKKEIVSPTNCRRRLQNTKDPMHINKIWKEKSTGEWKGVNNSDSIIEKFEMPYTENAEEMAKHMTNTLYGGQVENVFLDSAFKEGNKWQHRDFKVVRHGDNMTVYVMSLNWAYPMGYNPDLGYTE